MRSALHPSIPVFVLAALLGGTSAWAQEEPETATEGAEDAPEEPVEAPPPPPPLPPVDAEAVQRDVLVLVRALAYDRNLAQRFGGDLKVGVLHDREPLEGEPKVVLGVLDALKSVKIGGLSLSAVAVRWTDAAGLEGAVKDQEIDVLYIAMGLDDAAAAAPEVSHASKRATMTRHRPYLDVGLALGIDEVNGKPRVAVNLPAAKAEGASFTAELLRIAEVVR